MKDKMRLTCTDCGATIVRPLYECVDIYCWICGLPFVKKEKVNPRSMRIHQHPSQTRALRRNHPKLEIVR